MKLSPPANANYCATVVKVKTLIPLPGLDNLVGIPVFGMMALVSKDTQVGDVGIIFPAECQLSEEFAAENNLHRHGNLNKNPGIAGYLEDNRRVRAIKLRGNQSNALFMPLGSLLYALKDRDDLYELKEGAEFDELDGHPICKKYEVTRRGQAGHRPGPKLRPRTDPRFIPEQFNISNYFKVSDRLDQDETVIVTQKLHGTSLRVANTYVQRQLSLPEKIARFFGVKVRETEFAMVYGSHHVIKDANNPNQRHFYETDLWTEEGRKLDGAVPEGFVVYGEIIGWVDKGKPIQKHYTYDCEPGTRKMYVYRVAFVNSRGLAVDLPWDAVRLFCMERGLNHVAELWRGPRLTLHSHQWSSDLARQGISYYLNQNFAKQNIGGLRQNGIGDDAVSLSPDSPCDEGICIRSDGLGYQPEIYKAKSPIFLGHETKMLDEDVAADVEDEVAPSLLE